MSWARELGVASVSPATGAALRLLATIARARTIVEVGTGTGVSGLWLLRGLRGDGVLTSIDVESEHQALARQSFAAAGFAPARYRLITGAARDVLPRLADGAYDLVFVDGDVIDYPECVAAAARLLREDGVLVVPNVLVALDEPAERAAVADLVAALRNSPQWTTVVLTTGAGLLCATRTAG